MKLANAKFSLVGKFKLKTELAANLNLRQTGTIKHKTINKHEQMNVFGKYWCETLEKTVYFVIQLQSPTKWLIKAN